MLHGFWVFLTLYRNIIIFCHISRLFRKIHKIPEIVKFQAKVGGILMQANTTLSGAFFLESFTSTDVFPETSQVSKMEVFAEMINS